MLDLHPTLLSLLLIYPFSLSKKNKKNNGLYLSGFCWSHEDRTVLKLNLDALNEVLSMSG